jgi:predicted transcriptional regulator
MVPESELAVPIDHEGGPYQGLRDSDVEVLRSLGHQEALAFQGLKRKMHIHQEKLSRSLQRLEQDGLVAKTERGYVLTEKGIHLVSRWPSIEAREYMVILRSFIPGGTHPTLLARHLEGRWFGNLRGIGRKDSPEETILRWTTFDTEVEVRLGIGWGYITVDTDATDRDGLIDAFLATQLIYSQIIGPWNDTWDGSKQPITT